MSVPVSGKGYFLGLNAKPIEHNQQSTVRPQVSFINKDQLNKVFVPQEAVSSKAR
jgi:hypothetical protein